MKVTLAGYYGFANYGDDLFNLTAVLAARRWWCGHDLDILGPQVEGIEANFRIPRWFPRRLYTAWGAPGRLSRFSFRGLAMVTRDLLVYAGGSTFSYTSLARRLERLAAEHGITRFAGIGISVGPFANAEEETEVARFLRTFHYLSVRDRRSIALLEKMGVPVHSTLARDLVGALPPLLPPIGASPSAVTGSRPPSLGVSVCHYERLTGGDVAQEDRRNAALFEGIARFAQREGALVRVFCLNTNRVWGDAMLSHQLQDFLQRRSIGVEVVTAANNLLGCWYGLATSDAVISVRLHGGLNAYVCGVPFALVEYHVKTTDFLNDIGQSAALRMGPVCADPDEVEHIIDRLFRQPDSPALSYKTYVAEALDLVSGFWLSL